MPSLPTSQTHSPSAPIGVNEAGPRSSYRAVDAVDAHFHCRFWRSQRFRRTISQKSAYIGASGASGRLNGAACDAGTADLKPGELVPKIVVKMVRLFFTPPAYTLLHDLADRPAATFECLGAVYRAGEGAGLGFH